jgi:2-polyprenyl-3-methyl-5-hydroxy-6-metoxy-1,4-benzoquinol methylase
VERVDLNGPLPYRDDSFDYVACLEGLEHIENYHHALREFSRILKKDGILLISTPNPLNVKSRLRFLRFGTFYGFPHLVRMPAEGEHLHMSPINLSFLIAFAEKCGFALEGIHPVRFGSKCVGSSSIAGYCSSIPSSNYCSRMMRPGDS